MPPTGSVGCTDPSPTSATDRAGPLGRLGNVRLFERDTGFLLIASVADPSPAFTPCAPPMLCNARCKRHFRVDCPPSNLELAISAASRSERTSPDHR